MHELFVLAGMLLESEGGEKNNDSIGGKDGI